MDGRVVSHYRVRERLGAGGMGVVYRAEDSRLKRTVALKFLPAELTRDPVARERFIQEAQAASALDHPNICAIYDVDTADDQLFIAMAYYEGETLSARIARGPLTVADAVDVAVQIARGLEHAHHAGIVHRDIKPSNVMITRDGLVKIVDFGIAKFLDRTGPTRTGLTLGTVAYMAPEQVHGYAVDHRADLWSLGVVLFEALTARVPFGGERDMAILHNILHETPPAVRALRPDIPPALDQVVIRAMAKDREQRCQSAHEMIELLTTCLPAAPGSVSTMPLAVPPAAAGRRLVVVAAGVALLTAAVTAAWFIRRAANERRVEQLIGDVARLAAKDTYWPALAALEEVEQRAPGDSRLPALSARITETRDISIDPAGARVFIRPYDQPAQPWRLLGQAPIRNVRIPREYLAWKIERDGYVPAEIAGQFNRPFPPLAQVGQIPANTVRVPPGPLNLQLTGYNYMAQLPGGAFLIDKFEVTNRQFKAFVDQDGYAKPEYWTNTFAKDGRTLTWAQAMAEFRDRTGRPGPATWDVGMYPAGQDEYPVTGVSWYEADAFAKFSGRSLPTIYHWVRAAGIGSAAYITPLSNLNGKGPAAVGSASIVSPAGTADMAGNVKEWCANEVAGVTQRYLLGGSWRDPAHMFTFPDARAPFDRSEDNGFRLVTYEGSPAATLGDPIPRTRRDFRAEHPVSDAVYNAFGGLYTYDARPLDATVDAQDEGTTPWIRQRVSFVAAYGNERVPAYLFLPRHAPPPYQAVIHIPGAAAVTRGDSAAVIGQPTSDLRVFDFLILSGRAVLYPIYSGTFERNTGQASVWPNRTGAYRDWIVRVVNDGRRSMEYLQSRPDIRQDAIALMGVSWGATMAPKILALEPRFKTGVLTDGGFSYSIEIPPELDNLNYLTRVGQPILMVNGNGDFIFEAESGQKPFFDLLAAPRDHKRHLLLPGGHFILSQRRSQVVSAILDWLDQHLGPVRPALPPPPR